MKHSPFALAISILLGLLGGCGGSHHRSSPPSDVQQPDGSGRVAADLDGSWRITYVLPERWVTAGDPGCRIGSETGLMPPGVGMTITIAGHEFTDGHGQPLRREAVGGNFVVDRYLNQVNDRFALYTMQRRPDPQRAVAGESATLLMAMGTLDRDHLVGAIYHKVSRPRVEPGDAIEVMAQIWLERVP